MLVVQSFCFLLFLVGAFGHSLYSTTLVVTVHNHPIIGASQPVYFVDGIFRNNLTLTRGTTYRFLVQDESWGFYLTTSSSGGSFGQNIIADGVFPPFSAGGSKTVPFYFTPNNNHPNIIYYGSVFQADMGARIDLVGSSIDDERESSFLVDVLPKVTHPWQLADDASNGLVLNSEEGPTLTLVEGQAYSFLVVGAVDFYLARKLPESGDLVRPYLGPEVVYPASPIDDKPGVAAQGQWLSIKPSPWTPRTLYYGSNYGVRMGGIIHVVKRVDYIVDTSMLRDNVGEDPWVFTVNGVPTPELVLFRGHTYLFQVNTPQNHPLVFTASSFGGIGSSPLEEFQNAASVLYSNGVDSYFARVILNLDPTVRIRLGWGSEVVALDTRFLPDSFYYQSTFHESMGGLIRVVTLDDSSSDSDDDDDDDDSSSSSSSSDSSDSTSVSTSESSCHDDGHCGSGICEFNEMINNDCPADCSCEYEGDLFRCGNGVCDPCENSCTCAYDCN